MEISEERAQLQGKVGEHFGKEAGVAVCTAKGLMGMPFCCTFRVFLQCAADIASTYKSLRSLEEDLKR